MRFLCPAIVSPDGFGVIPELPNPEHRRALILITKTLQNLANGVHFQDDRKEPYMVKMNRFIETNLKKRTEVLDRFAVREEK